MMSRPSSSLLCLALALSAALTGCAVTSPASFPSETHAGASFSGSIHGGQAPIVGAAIYLFAASTTGYGSANTSLLTPGDVGVLTDSHGNGYVLSDGGGGFTITGDYACPPGNSQVYLLGLGGNPGLSGLSINANSALIAALGTCSSLTPTTFITMNELTTVAAMSALAPFTTATASTVTSLPPFNNFPAMAISSSASNTTGLNNAFALAAVLANNGTGVAPAATPSGLGITPQLEINSLGDILAACVSSSGGTSGDTTNCGTLFTKTTPPTTSPTAPVNTIQAMLNITHYPGQNVLALWNLITPASPFQPNLPPAYDFTTGTHDLPPVNDWTLAIGYPSLNTFVSGNQPADNLVVDSKSNIWFLIAGAQTAVYINPIGTVLTEVGPPSASYQLQQGLGQSMAIDAADNLWVGNGSYGISEISGSSLTLVTANVSSYGYEPGPNTDTDNGLLRGVGGLVLSPTTGHVWVGNNDGGTSSVFDVFPSNGYLNANYSGGGILNTIGMAFDQTGNLWLANEGGSCCNPMSVTKMTQAGAFLSGASGFTGGGIQTPLPLAIDKAGNAWVGSTYGALTVLAGATGAPILGSPISGGGLGNTKSIAVDGADNIWVASYNGISEFNGTSGAAISTSAGWQSLQNGYGLNQGSGVAVDASGNVWLTTSGMSLSLDGNVTCCTVGGVVQIVGIAAPTINPIVTATANATIGTLP